MNKISNSVREKCVRLRVDDRKSLKEIANEVGVSKTFLSSLLKPYPLTKEEDKKRHLHCYGGGTPKNRGVKSKFYKMTEDGSFTNMDKAKIAEAAVLFRITLHGMEVYGSPFDGDKMDWVIRVGEKFVAIQVRWTRKGTHGLPYVSLKCSDGRKYQRRYNDGEFDFLIGYDLYTDNAYVWSEDELKNHKSAITISENACEKWDKIIKSS